MKKFAMPEMASQEELAMAQAKDVELVCVGYIPFAEVKAMGIKGVITRSTFESIAAHNAGLKIAHFVYESDDDGEYRIIDIK